jgi:hypothetical protein
MSEADDETAAETAATRQRQPWQVAEPEPASRKRWWKRKAVAEAAGPRKRKRHPVEMAAADVRAARLPPPMAVPVAVPVAAPERPAETERGRQPGQRKQRTKASTRIYLLGALIGLGVSVNTSWRYFDLKMGIHDTVERISMFAGMEVVLLACGVAMFEAARDPKATAGPARSLAWLLCGVSAFAALQLSGGLVGPMRVILGPVLALVALHRALGIEMRSVDHESTGTLARVGREMRERLLSRLQFADDDRDAAERTKARAARRAAHLSRASGLVPFRKRRLSRAVRTADIAHDERQRQRLLAEVQMIEHTEALRTLQTVSPWQVAEPEAEMAVETAVATLPETVAVDVAEPETATEVAEPVAAGTEAAAETVVMPVVVAETATAVAAAELQRQARERYRQSLVAGQPLSGDQLGAAFGRSGRWGRAQIAEAKTSGNVLRLATGGKRG